MSSGIVKKKIRRILSAILVFVYLFTSTEWNGLIVNVNANEQGYIFSIDGTTVDLESETEIIPVELEYGVHIKDVLSCKNSHGDDIEGISYMVSADNDEWTNIDNSTKLDIGSYYLGYNDGEVEIISESPVVTIKAATVAAPTDISFSSGNLSFSESKTSNGYNVDDNVIEGYEVSIFKDNENIDVINMTETSKDLTSTLLLNGAGIYSCKIVAKLKSGTETKYALASASEIKGNVYVVSVKQQGVKGISVPETEYFLIPGNESYNKVNLSASCSEGYGFTGFNNVSGFVISDVNTELKTGVATINDNYNGEPNVVIGVTSVDSKAPYNVILEEGSDDNQGKIVCKAVDDESGVYAYAFTTKEDKGDVTNWTVVDSPLAGDFEIAIEPTDVGKYYLFVKDGSNNITRSETYIPVTKIVYNNYYDTNLIDFEQLIIGKDKTLSIGNRPEFTFEGWYDNGTFEGEAITIVPEEILGTEIQVYGKWKRNDVVFITQPTYVEREYNGENVVLNAAIKNNDGEVSWQWYKDGTAIQGATAASYVIGKDAKDYGTYYVVASVTAPNDSEVKTGQSTSVDVNIKKIELDISADNKRKTYGDEDPELTYSYDATKIVSNESIIGLSINRAEGEDAKGYAIKVSQEEGTNPNYNLTLIDGVFTIEPKSVVDLTYSGIDKNGYNYTGEEITPEVLVKNGDVNLVEETDYIKEYINNVKAGTAIYRITGSGNYTGTKDIEFQIKKATFSASVSRLDYTYGNTKSAVVLDTNISGGSVKYYYRKKGTIEYKEAEPTDAGEYEFYAVIAETTNYSECVTPVNSFKINQRVITITSYGGEWVYDGNAHTVADKYDVDGDFVGSDDFKSISITGSITDVGEKENTISYTLSAKNPENYKIEQIRGILKITKSSLVSPTNFSWKQENPGTANWIAIYRTGLVVLYDVELFRIDGEEYTKIGDTITTDKTSIDFTELIKEDSETNGIAKYAFKIRTKVSPVVSNDNINKDNYKDSEYSDYSSAILTAKLSIADELENGISSATINNKSSEILIAGEKADLKAEFETGYSSANPLWTVIGTENNNIVNFENSSDKQTKVSVPNNLSKLKEITIFAGAVDEIPVIESFEASTDDNKSVKLELKATDSRGIVGWLISKNDSITEFNAEDGWDLLVPMPNNKEITKSIDVTSKGSYYAYVIDSGNNIVRSKNPISIYSISFEGGAGAVGSMDSLLKINNVDIQLPKNIYSKLGYGFKNWKGTKGDLYSNEGSYAFNSDSVLTAQWSDEIYTYTVNYYVMDVEGNYSETPELSQSYTSLYGYEITPTTAGVERSYKGTILDEERNTTIEITSDNLVLNIYYKRTKSSVIYTYTLPGESEPVVVKNTYYYDQEIPEELEKPVVPGYTFIGWDYDGYGALPEKMPIKDINASGSFSANQTTYTINYYKKNLEGENTYTLSNMETINSIHGTAIEVNQDVIMQYTGFVQPEFIITNGIAGGANPDVSLFKTECEGIVSEVDHLYINCYYSRETYNLNLEVYSGSTMKYTNTWQVLYGEPIDADYYSNYDSENWYVDADKDGKRLASYRDWSTGMAPSTMPAGDVTVRREYIYSSYNTYYGIKFFFETFDKTTGEHTGYEQVYNTTYYCAEGSTRTIGPDGSGAYWKFSEFKDYITNFDYYEYNANPDGYENITSIVTVEGQKQYLEVYFDRKTVNSKVNYYYYNDDGTTTLIGSDDYSGKWGERYDIAPFKYFDQYNDLYGECSVSYSGYYYMNYLGSQANPNGGNYWVEKTVNYWPGHKYTGADIDTWNTMMIFGQLSYSAKNPSANVMNVYYSEVDPNEQYFIDIKMNENLTLDTKKNQQIKIKLSNYGIDGYDDKEFKLRVANESYFYNYTLSYGDEFESYPVSKKLAENTFKYIYDLEDDFKSDEYEKVTINNIIYYLDTTNDYIYIADKTNQYYKGNRASYSPSTKITNANYIAYDVATAHLYDYKTTYEEEDLNAISAYVVTSGNSWTMKPNTSYTYTYSFEYADIFQVYYTIEGKKCPTTKEDGAYHRYVNGTVIKPECKHSIFEDRTEQGYEIVWYKSTWWDLSDRVGDLYTVSGDVTFYGRYEKSVHNCHNYVYYELADPIEYNDEEINYITENEVADLLDAGVLTTEEATQEIDFADEYYITKKSITTTKYYLKGELVLIDISYPVLATNDVSFLSDNGTYWKAYNKYNEEGFHYDETNTNNKLVGYCQNKPISLKAYYARDTYNLTVDKKNSKISNKEVFTYPYDHTITLEKPVKEGYVFEGWQFESVNDEIVSPYDLDITTKDNGDVVFSMPESDIIATAIWSCGEFTNSVVHYFQKPDKSYDTQLFNTMRAIESIEESEYKKDIDFSFNDITVSGYLYLDEDNNRLGVSFVDGDREYYFEYTEDGDINVGDSEIIAIVEKDNLETEATINVSDHDIDGFTIFSFDYSTYRYETNVNKLTFTDTFDAFVGMSLEYYYKRLSNIEINLYSKSTVDTAASGVTMTGDGIHSYGEKVKLVANLEKGFDFVGWAYFNDVIENGQLVSDYKEKLLTTDETYVFKVTKSEKYIAITTPEEVEEPIVSVGGVSNLIYGYEKSDENYVNAIVDLTDLDDSTYVAGYQWYKDGVIIENANSAFYIIQTGLEAGEHVYKCVVTIGRKDNKQTRKIETETHTLTVSPTSMNVVKGDYSGIYDGKTHGIDVNVVTPSKSSDYTIYYSDVELTKDNYSTDGNSDPTVFNSYHDVKYNAETKEAEKYKVYYYIKSNNKNYSDAAGYGTVYITQKELVLKSQSVEGVGVYQKTYNGKKILEGSIFDETTEKGKLSNGGYYQIDGVASGDAIVLGFDAVLDSPHKDTATSVSLSNLEVYFRNNQEENHNYVIRTNYNITLPAEVVPFEIKNVWDTDNTFEYDGNTHKTAFEIVNYDEIPVQDANNIKVLVTGEQKNVGDYYANAVIELVPNAVGTYTSDFKFSSGKKAYKIVQKNLTIKPEETTVSYDGQEHNYSNVTVTGIISNQTYTYEKTNPYINAGTYTVKAKNMEILDTDKKDVTYNYNITYAESNFKIDKKKIIISNVIANNKTYDGNVNAVLDFTNATISGVIDEDKEMVQIDTSKITGKFVSPDAGEDVVVAITIAEDAIKGEKAGNYIVDVEHSVSEDTANISGAAITLIPDDLKATYGDSVTFTAKFSGGREQDKDLITSKLSKLSYKISAVGSSEKISYSKAVVVGKYTIHIDYSELEADEDLANYTFGSNTGVLEIEKRTITPISNEKITKTYDGTKKAIVTADNYRFYNSVNDDEITLKSFNAEYNSKDVSSASKVIVKNAVLDDNSAKNYKLDTTTFDIDADITRKPLEVTANNLEKTYGSAIPEFSVSYKGFVVDEENDINEDSSVLTGTVSYDCNYRNSDTAENRKVGTYVVTPSGYGETNGNYVITYKPGNLTITKAEITVKGTTVDDDDTIIYKVDEIPDTTYTTSGWFYDETIAVASNVDSVITNYETTITSTSEAGNYKIAVNGNLEADNYSFKYVNGNLKIDKHELTIRGITVDGKQYDGTKAVESSKIDISDVEYVGILAADEEFAGIIDVIATYDNENAGTGKTVNLTYKLNEYLSKRYSIKDDSQKTTTADITKKPITITPKEENIVYGSAIPSYKYVVDGLVKVANVEKNDITGTPEYTCSYTNISDVNLIGYDLTVTGLTSNNYSISYLPSKVKVSKAKLSKPAPAWSTESVTNGRASWSAVSGIGNVTVEKYKVELFKDSSVTPVYSEETTNTYCELLEKIRENGVGKYYVCVTAIASHTNNEDNKNVDDSDASKSGDKYAAKVKFVFDTADDYTKAAATGGSIKINSTESNEGVFVSGEKAINLNATIKNETGYTLKACKSANSAITVNNPSLTLDKFTGTFDIAMSLATSTDIEIALTVQPRAATVVPSVEVVENNNASYGYSADKAPRLKATAVPADTDNLESSDDYIYTYKWSYKKGKTGTVIDLDSTTDECTLPTGLLRYDPYIVTCVVTAERKDNGCKTEAEAKTNVTIVRAKLSTSVVIEDWEYGDTRKNPSLTAHDNNENPTITYYYGNSSTGPWTAWNGNNCPSDVGTWYTYAKLGETSNFSEFNTAVVSFDITANKLSTPTGLSTLNSTEKAPYGIASWNAVTPPKENNGVNSKSSVGVKYEVELYYYSEGDTIDDASLKKTYNNITTTKYDLVNDIKEPGYYSYKVKAIANNSGSAVNCLDSDKSEYSAWLHVGCDISVEDNGIAVTSDSYEKVYDGKNVVLTALSPDAEYQWYKNGTLISGETNQTLVLKNVSEGYYSCKVKIEGYTFDTTYKQIKITKRPITVTSGTSSKTFDGKVLVDYTSKIKDGTDTFTQSEINENIAIINETKTGDKVYVTITGTQTSAGESNNTISSIEIKNGNEDVKDNYTVTPENGKLTVNRKSLNNGDSYGSGIEVEDISDVVYKGTAYEPSVVVKYSLVSGTTYTLTASDYKVEYANNIHYGTATITITGLGNYSGSIEKTFNIKQREITIASKDKTKVYDGTPLNSSGITELTVKSGTIADGDSISSVEFTSSVTNVLSAIDNTFTNVVIKRGTENVTNDYKITPAYDGKLTVTKREVKVTPYSQNKIFGEEDPELTYATSKTEKSESGLVTDDSLNIVVVREKAGTTDGEKVGEYKITASEGEGGNPNYTVIFDNSTSKLKIGEAGQNAPELTGVAETIDGKADGKISGLTTEMEYRVKGTTEFTKVTNVNMELEDNTYEVRYAEKQNYNPSPIVEVIVEKGRKLTVTVIADKVGYNFTVDKSEITWHESVKINYELKPGYTETDSFAIKVNDSKVTTELVGTKREHTISNPETDLVIKVEGVKDITAPTGVVKIKSNEWTSLKGSVLYKLFYKNATNVTITANDLGSGVKNIKYYAAREALTLDEIEAIDDWVTYTEAKSIAPVDIYIIYARLEDNAGNVSYISTDAVISYKDSYKDTEEITYVKASNQSKDAKVKLNGNTIKGLKEGDTSLVENTDYTIDNDVITFKAAYLQSHVKGEYAVTVEYAPLGHEYVEDDENDEPLTTLVKLKIEKNNSTISYISDPTKEYNGSEITVPTYSLTGSTGEVVIEYKKKGQDDDKYTTEKPINAGEYVVRVTVAEDENYNGTKAEKEFKINPKAVVVKFTAENKTYDGNVNATVTGKIETGVDGEKINVSGYTGTFENMNVGNNKNVTMDISEIAYLPETGTTLSNYNITCDTSVKANITKRTATIDIDDGSKTYGADDPTFTYTVTNLAYQDELEGITIVREQGENVDEYEIFASYDEADNMNYSIEVNKGNFTINKKNATVKADNKEKVYGKSDPELTYTATGVLEGDELTGIIIEREAGENFGDYAISVSQQENCNKNYNIQFTNGTFSIKSANQEVPEVTGIPETIDGKADGKISGLKLNMEYRVKGTTDFIKVTDVNMEFEDDTYEVRYASDANHIASECAEVTVEKGRKLIVTVIADKVGYDFTVDKLEIKWHENVGFVYELKTGYTETENFAIKVNDVKVDAALEDGKRTYDIENPETDLVIKVEGVKDITAPTGAIKVKANEWEELKGTILYEIFYKNAENVIITANDLGSGVNNIKYYAAEESLTLEEIKEINDWVAYTDGFDIVPVGINVIYARLEDNAGNISYISTDAIVSYEDSQKDTEEITYVKASNISKDAKVKLNGNTISSIKEGNAVLVKNTDYTINDDVITFKAGYLQSHLKGEYTVTVEYAPLGHEYVDDDENDEPLTTDIKINVIKDNSLIANISDLTKKYDGNVVSTPTYDLTGSTGLVVIEYKEKEQADNYYTTEMPVNVGEYVVRISVSEDDNYNGIKAEKEFKINPRDVVVEFTAEDKVYDGNEVATITGDIETGIDAEKITVSGVTGKFENADVGSDKNVILDVSEIIYSAETGTMLKNYSITVDTSVTASITKREAVVDIDDKSKIYGDIDPTFTYNVSNLVSGEELEGITISREQGEDVGKYDITGSSDENDNKNYTVKINKGKFTINKKDVTVTVDDNDKIYGDEDSEFTYRNSELIGNDKLIGIVISREQGEDVGKYDINAVSPEFANKNYNIAFVKGTFEIKKRVISVKADNKEKYYGDAEPEFTFTPTNLVGNDKLTGINMEREVGENTGNYVIFIGQDENSNKNYDIQFTNGNLVIKNASQPIPDVTGVAETIDGKADGKISGLTLDMEYRVKGSTDFIKITDLDMELEDNTYEVRYAKKDNYNESPIKEVVVEQGRKLTVTVVADRIGYDFTADKSEISWHEDVEVQYELKPGYTETESFAIKVNDKKVTTEILGGKRLYTIDDPETDLVIKVEGVKDITPPDGTIEVKDSIWNQLHKDINDIYYKEKQAVTISATDLGSGVKSIEYIIRDNEISAVEIENATDWKVYTESFTLKPVEKYVIYAKLSDNVGNISYLSTDGLVVDNIPPVISGVEDNGIYCENKTIEVSDPYLYQVKVDGENVELTEGKYVIAADKKEHKISASDKSGNETKEITITMGHKFGEPVFEWSEDLKSAKAKFVCEYYDTHIIELDAVISQEVTAQTCVKEGVINYTATVEFENEIYTATNSEIIPKNPHNYGEWYIVKEPTYTEKGIKERDCIVCGTEQIQDIPMKDLDDEPGVIEGIVIGEDEVVYTVTIEMGSTVLQSIKGIHTNEKFRFENLENGEYNVVVSAGDNTVTRMATITNGSHVNMIIEIIGNKNSRVLVKDDGAPNVAVEGLQDIFNTSVYKDDEDAVTNFNNGGRVKIQLEAGITKDADTINQIKKKAEELNKQVGMIFDLDIYMYIITVDDTIIKPIYETENLILVAVPVDEKLIRKTGLQVIRKHNNEIQLLQKTDSIEENPIGECFYIADKYVYIWADKYSTYSIIYDKDKIENSSDDPTDNKPEKPTDNNSDANKTDNNSDANKTDNQSKPVRTGDDDSKKVFEFIWLLSCVAVVYGASSKKKKDNR